MWANLHCGKNIFTQIRKIKARKKTLLKSIDGCLDSESIANVFSVKYSALYNLKENDTNSFEYHIIIRFWRCVPDLHNNIFP